MEDKFVDNFPVAELNRFNEMLAFPLWDVNVKPGGELEVLLDASIDFCKRGVHTKSEPCQNFIRKGLFKSFNKLLDGFDGPAFPNSELNSEFNKCIFSNAKKLVDLIVLHLKLQDFSLAEMLALLCDPHNKFHTFNASRPPESYNMKKSPSPDDELFARHFVSKKPKGWLVDLINRFGTQGGFDALLELFCSPKIPLTVSQVYALLKPFASCTEFLTKHTAQKYFYTIHLIVLEFLEEMSDHEIRQAAFKSEAVATILQCLMSISTRLTESHEQVLLKLVSRRVISRIQEVPKAEEGGENLSQIKILSYKLDKKEEALINLASSNRNEMIKNAELLQKLSTTTEKNKALEEEVKNLENKLELDSKDWKNKYETNLKENQVLKETIKQLATKSNETQSILQNCPLDIEGVKKPVPPVFPSFWSKFSKSMKASSSLQSEQEKEPENENASNKTEAVNPETLVLSSSVKTEVVTVESPVLSSSLTCPSPAYLEIFEENKNNLAIKILEKLSLRHLLDARLVSKKWNQLIIPILLKNEKLTLEFTYTKQQNVHPLTSDLNLEKSLRRTLCQFNKVLQSARTIAEKSLFDDSSSSCSFPCIRFSFDLRTLSKMEFNRGALYKFFTSHLNNFSTLKQLTLTESDDYLNGKMQQEHHEIILKILKVACNKIEDLDISGLYSTSNRSGIEIESSPDKYFSKLESMKTDGNLFALNGWILSSAPVLKNVDLCQYKSIQHLKIFEKHICLDLIQRLEIKIPTTLHSSVWEALIELPLDLKLRNLKFIKLWTGEFEEDRRQGKEKDKGYRGYINKKQLVAKKEMPSIIIRILKAVESSLEILECGDAPFCICHAIEYPELPKLHTFKYIQDAGQRAVGFLGHSSEFDEKFENLTKIILDLNYVSDDWFRLFCDNGILPSVQSLEISNESFLRKEIGQNLREIAASFPNLRKFKTCDPQRVHTHSCFLQFIWNHLKGLESLELTLGKKAASHGPALHVDSVITGLSLPICVMIYDSEKNISSSTSKKEIKEPSITHLKDLKRFTLHLDDLSSLICQKKENYPLLSKVTGKFVATLMPNLRVTICVPLSLLEKARETSIGPFVTFIGEE